MARTLSLVQLTSLPVEAQLQIRDIRNLPEIRAVMYTDRVIEFNEHLHWLRLLKDDRTKIAFAVIAEVGAPAGLVSLQRIDRHHKRAEWAFYLRPEEWGGLGPALQLSTIDFAFERLGLEKLDCEVIEGNNSVVKLHQKFFFEREGFRYSELVREGRRIGVHLLGLRRDTWREKRASLVKRYAHVFDGFDVHVKWSDPEFEEQSPLDRIEAARSRNNLNWMSILRLAIERSPEAAGRIVAEIKLLDQEISGLTEKLMDSLQKPDKC